MSKKVKVKIEDSQIWCNVIEKVFEMPDNVTDVNSYLIENDFEGDCLISEEYIDFIPIETVDFDWEIIEEEDLSEEKDISE